MKTIVGSSGHRKLFGILLLVSFVLLPSAVIYSCFLSSNYDQVHI